MDKAAAARRTRLSAEQRRESILRAATDVFAATGYRAGKVSEVAARVSVSEPVIFQNFGSKAALFAAVLDRMVTQVRAELDAMASDRVSVPAVLAHILGPAAQGATHPGRRPHRALFADAAALIAEPGGGEPAGDVARLLAGHLADLVRRGQAEGDIRPGLSPDAAAWLLLSVLSARALRAAAMPGPGQQETAVADLALRAILAPA